MAQSNVRRESARRALRPALMVGLAGMGLGLMTGVLIAYEQRPPANIPFFSTASFQNFALAAGGLIGMLAGALACLLFLRLARRRRYVRLSPLGVGVGAGACTVIGLATCLVVYLAAPAFKMVPIGLGALVVEAGGYTFADAMVGVAAGYLAVEIWGRRLSYWD